jgi:hypothetical protein
MPRHAAPAAIEGSTVIVGEPFAPKHSRLQAICRAMLRRKPQSHPGWSILMAEEVRMSDRDTAVLRERMHAHEIGHLLTILGPERDGYTPSAVELAEEELRRRGVDELVILHLRGFLDRRASAEAGYLTEQLRNLRESDGAAGNCHLCSRMEVAAQVPFALARPGGSSRFAEADAVRLHLRLCTTCLGSRVKLSGEDCARHPDVEAAQELGFRHFISPRELVQVVAELPA